MSHACWKVTVNFFWACPCRLLHMCFRRFVDIPVAVCIRPLVVLPSSLRFCPFSRLLSLRWVFWLTFFHLTFDFCFDVFVFDVLEVSALACFLPQPGLWLIRASLSSSQFSNREDCYVSRECSIWRTPFFSDGIFLLRPLIALSLTSFLVVLFSTCSLIWCTFFFRHRSWSGWVHA